MGRRKTNALNEIRAANANSHVTPVSEAGAIDQGSIPGEAIAQRAYQLFEERGAEPGYDLDDWYRAEQDLREQKRGGNL